MIKIQSIEFQCLTFEENTPPQVLREVHLDTPRKTKIPTEWVGIWAIGI